MAIPDRVVLSNSKNYTSGWGRIRSQLPYWRRTGDLKGSGGNGKSSALGWISGRHSSWRVTPPGESPEAKQLTSETATSLAADSMHRLRSCRRTRNEIESCGEPSISGRAPGLLNQSTWG